VTSYGIDLDRRELIATWGSGEGNLSTRTAALPADADSGTLLALAGTLTQLSEAAWAAYTRPPSDDPSPEDPSDSDPDTAPAGWRQDQEESEYAAKVTEAITRPNLPRDGSLVIAYSPLIENANRVGRVLHALGDPELTRVIVAEAAAELDAVERASLGDLSGRSQQAVLLSREDASPVQVAAADRLFEKDPFGPAELFSTVDPTAAAVAAAHWLAAAAEVSASVSGHDAAKVVFEADNLEALPYETPTVVLELIAAGARPYEAVTGLVREALHIAGGLLPDPSVLREQLNELEETLSEQHSNDDDPELADVALRLTPLDPQRPSRDLLEDLHTGIHACWLLYDECSSIADDVDGRGDAEAASAPGPEQLLELSRHRFADLVRETAARHHDRLI